MRTLAEIIYLSEETSENAFNALDFLGIDGLFEYMKAHDSGEYYDTFEDDENNSFPEVRKQIGTASRLHIELPYLIGLNPYLKDISLYKVIQA